jgi:Spy/CpxP family protein refolding chaperone
MKNYLIAALLLLATTSITAQPGGRGDKDARRAEIEKQKVAYITTQLDLTVEESQAFWPVYNAYNTELRERKSEIRGELRALRADTLNMSDAEIDELIRAKFAAEREKLELDEKYYEKFKAVLPVRKVAEFYRAEKSFQRELLDQMRSRGQRGQTTPAAK